MTVRSTTPPPPERQGDEAGEPHFSPPSTKSPIAGSIAPKVISAASQKFPAPPPLLKHDRSSSIESSSTTLKESSSQPKLVVKLDHVPEPTSSNFNKNHQLNKMESTGTSKSITYGSQSELPRLPIPTLDETLQKFLQCLQALQTADEFQASQAAVQDFYQTDGPMLQQLLMEYDQSLQSGSYVEEFWNESYLAPDASVVLNLNPFFVLEDGPDPKTAKDPLKRAASLTFASLKLACQLKRQEFPIDTLKNKQPLCMDQFKALFGCARVPVSGTKDDICVYDQSNHIVIFKGGRMYYVQCLNQPTNTDSDSEDWSVAVDIPDLMDILQTIQQHSESKKDTPEDGVGLGVLTSLPRSEWAQARHTLQDYDPLNENSLAIIDSALFVLVLDDSTPQSPSDMAANMLHGSYQVDYDSVSRTERQQGTCGNRWYDKLQIIVCADGVSGINFEHSAIDGHTALRFVSDVYAETVISFAQSITKLVAAQHDLIPHVIDAPVVRAKDKSSTSTLDVFPKRIPFLIPPSIQTQMYHAETHLGDQIVATDTHCLEFGSHQESGYGKLFIVSHKLSPDSFVQLSMMLAYYQLYGKLVCAYEPVLTKQFYHGRTEAMRPATVQAKQLCELFCNTQSDGSDIVTALRDAAKMHSKLVKECAQGKGVDRHLFALKCIAERNGLSVPDFFTSAAWQTLNHTILSTSNCGNPALRLFGFGPVVADGLGIGYIIKDHSIHFSISSKARQTKRYAHTLSSVLERLQQLLRQDQEEQLMLKGEMNLKKRISMEGIIDWKTTKNRKEPMKSSSPSQPVDSKDDDNDDAYGDIWGESVPPPPPPAALAEPTQSWTIGPGSLASSLEQTRRRQSSSMRLSLISTNSSAAAHDKDDNSSDDEQEEFTMQVGAPVDIPGANVLASKPGESSNPSISRSSSNDSLPVKPGRRGSMDYDRNSNSSSGQRNETWDNQK